MGEVDVHERILSRVAPAALAKGCNKALVRDVKSIQRRLNEAKAAFAKLKEVEKAVSQLQEGKNDKSRSISLVKVMEETVSVENEFLEGLKRFGELLKAKKDEVGGFFWCHRVFFFFFWYIVLTKLFFVC